MPFQYIGLPSDTFASLHAMSDAQLAAIGAQRMAVDEKPGFPCRVTLADAEPGERVILLSYNHQNAQTPYKSAGPIFVREAARDTYNSSAVPAVFLTGRLLSARAYDANGMMVDADVVEGAQIDKKAHTAQPCEQIGETIAFDNAIKLALDWAAAHPDTLIIVTADHGHSTQIVPLPKPDNHSSGLMSTLTTADKANMTLLYGTNSICCASEHSMEHTGTQVRIAAQGPQAFRLLGVHDMSEVFHLMAQAIGAE